MLQLWEKLKEKKIRNLISVIFLSFPVFLIDFFSKLKIISIFRSGDIEKIYINQFLDFILVFNTGISYGLFSGGGKFQKWILIIISLGIILFLLNFVKNESSFTAKTSISFIIGGALGNVFDRLFYGAVVDFISLHAKGFSWYIFNVADMFIVFGVILFLLSQLLKSDTKLENWNA